MQRAIPTEDGGNDLRAVLENMDVAETKSAVFQASVGHFALQAGHFLEHAEGVGGTLRHAPRAKRRRRKNIMYSRTERCNCKESPLGLGLASDKDNTSEFGLLTIP